MATSSTRSLKIDIFYIVGVDGSSTWNIHINILSHRKRLIKLIITLNANQTNNMSYSLTPAPLHFPTI